MAVSRRSFLKGSAATAAISVVGSGAVNLLSAKTTALLAAGPGNKWPGRVVVNFNKEAATGVTANETVIKTMVDDAILVLAGQTVSADKKAAVGAAWKAIFPATLTAQSKIAIKINILNPGNPAPHAFSVMGITEGLQQMDFSGTKFPAANITIYDSNNSSAMDAVGYTAVRFPNIALVKDTAQAFGDGALSNRAYAKTLHDSDFLINVFSPRGHSVGGNFSLGFKSHFGTYATPSGMHSNAEANLRDINCNGPVLNKTVLCVCSGVFGMNESNGPTGGKDDYSTYSKKIDPASTNTNPTTIIMSTDPVSCDMQAIKMIRMNSKKTPPPSYETANLPNYLKASGGISGTLTPVNNIGVIEESAMDVRKIINAQPVKAINNYHLQTNNGHTNISASQLKGQNITFIEYVVPPSYVNQKASVEILSLNGKKIIEFQKHIQGVANHFSWDEKDKNGRQVSAGNYVVKLQSGSLNATSHLSIMR